MVTKNDIKNLLMIIAIQYSKEIDTANTEKFIDLVNLWYEILKNYDYSVLKQATMMALANSSFCPKVANIVQNVNILLTKNKKSPEQLLDDYIRAMKKVASIKNNLNSSIYIEELKKTVGQMESENFENIYNELDTVIKDYLLNNKYNLFKYSEFTVEDFKYEKIRFLKYVENKRDYEKIYQFDNDNLISLNKLKIE